MYISRQKLQFTKFILIYFIYLFIYFFGPFSSYILLLTKEDFVVTSKFLVLHNIMSSEDAC